MPVAPVLPSRFVRYVYANGAISQRWVHILIAANLLDVAVVWTSPSASWKPLAVLLAISLFFVIGILSEKAKQIGFDRANNRFRHSSTYFRVLTIGGWQPLPPISRVVVKHYSEYTIASRRSWQVNTAQQSYIVLLSVPAPQQAIIAGKFQATQAAEAMLYANEIAAHLGVDAYIFE